MYCKRCGHRSDQKTEKCQKCGAKLATEVAIDRAPRTTIRWKVLAGATLAAVVALVVVPRVFFKPELETIGPTDKLRFLRLLEKSPYRRAGQVELRLEQQTLVVIWDLRWNALPEAKQRDIVRMTGRAWTVVGGEKTEFRITGETKAVAEYRNGEVSLAP
jgi:hypothetical protein